MTAFACAVLAIAYTLGICNSAQTAGLLVDAPTHTAFLPPVPSHSQARCALQMAVEEAEFERAKERITLKHKNTSRWARRALKRGVNLADEGTKDALYEQMRLGREIREKAATMRDDVGSSGESDARCAALL